jgi:hypothetical protein
MMLITMLRNAVEYNAEGNSTMSGWIKDKAEDKTDFSFERNEP